MRIPVPALATWACSAVAFAAPDSPPDTTPAAAGTDASIASGAGSDPAADDWKFDLDGYYRARGYAFGGLFPQKQAGRYMQQRLRLEPGLNYQDVAKFHMQADIFDDAVWGDNESLASTALFAADPSTTDSEGQQQPSIKVKRAWVEFDVPVGLLRVGRQPSEWGLGILTNGGDGFDDTFGENHTGSTYDRVLFATRPIAIAQAAMGHDDTHIPLYAAVGVDRLVEDPLIQYYGYKCVGNIAQGEPGYDARCDSDGDGVTDLNHDYTDDSRTDSNRGSDWWVDNADDVLEMIYVLVYDGKGVNLFGHDGDLTAGTYWVNRRQKETASNVWIADAYLHLGWQGLVAEGEAVTIRGSTNAIALPGAFDTSASNPLHKTADIWGYVGRLGYERPSWTVMMESGYASGDDDPADARFTGRPLHPDFNVGLLLYEEVLARVTAAHWGEAGRGLWSQGGVYNSRYVFPNLRYRPVKNWEIIGAYLQAWPDKPDGAIIQCARFDSVECATNGATARDIGWEIDGAVKTTFDGHMLFSLEAGYARVSDRIDLASIGLDPAGEVWTLQSRVAYEF